MSKITDIISGENVFDMFSELSGWHMSHLLTWRGVYDLYCSQPPGGDRGVLASLFGELSYGQHITMTSVTDK